MIQQLEGPDQADRLQNLGLSYRGRYRQGGAPDDLENAIQYLQEAVGLTPDDDPNHATLLNDLSICYFDRYKHLGVSGDLEAAIQSSQKAVNLTPIDHPSRANKLNNLAIHYRNRYRQFGALSDLEAAIQCNQQAINLTPEDHPSRASRLNNLAIHYRSKYTRLGTLSDLEAAIQCDQQAINLTIDDDHPNRARLLDSLAISYFDRYKELGDLSDLEATFRFGQQAVNSIPDHHPDQAGPLQNLAIGYADRYKRTGALNDLELSIQLFQKASGLTLENDPYRASQLHNLGLGYGYRYERTEALNDLELSIQLIQEAVDLTPRDHSDRANRLHSLGVRWNFRYERTGALGDLELSIQMIKEAVDLTSQDHPDRAGRLHSLGIGYSGRYERIGEPNDLELSIRMIKEAVNLTPQGHSDRAGRLHTLGIGYRQRYERTEALDDLELSIQQYQEALNHASSPPVDRLRAGRDLFRSYAEAKNWGSAYDAASLAISLIPLYISRSLERSDVQHQVNEIIGMASKATTIALRAGKPAYEATRLLEVGRGIIASSLGDMRTDITDLNEKFPESAEEFNRLRDLLDSPKKSRTDTQQQRYNTGKQLEELIQKIRSLHGFDRFLLGPSEDEMRRATIHGPIVVVNVSGYGCHALIIDQQKGFRALELPSLNIEEVRAKAEELASPNTEMLRWLWNNIANPVLISLNFVQTPEHTWPRVWWILTGPLARFPIHAAGRYSEVEGEIHATVMDRVVSSYSSSVRAIIDAHRNTSSVSVNSPKEESMVLVGMEETPGYSSLQFAQEEIEVLAQLGTSMQLQVKQPLSLQKETLSALSGSCKIFHFAGHGYTDLSNPSDSALVLSDGKLTVESIFDTNLQHKPFLAYLSACGTGQIKHDNLIDEGIHLVGACQLAGFRHVIGTLWQVNDKSCVDVAKMTYEYMQKHGLSDSSVSEGLHHACRELRSRWLQESETRASRCGTKSKGSADVISNKEQSRSAQAGARAPRVIEAVEDLPMHWIPYVHFGI